MAKIYSVTLTDTERDELTELVARRSGKSLPVRRAYILLAADENGEQGWTDLRICEAYRVSPRTVERTRKRFVMDGFKIAVHGKKREVFREKILDGEVEARLIALRCADPPAGYAKWTLELLADRMVELNYVEHISRESVRKI
ncbi:MAG: helix-turn-helix domain-containing protein [Candidatus Electrothrix sp. AR4]|nr:helix-turn-helix domain-containing protein [Candidatus Electrothrix sp. AR4]